MFQKGKPISKYEFLNYPFLHFRVNITVVSNGKKCNRTVGPFTNRYYVVPSATIPEGCRITSSYDNRITSSNERTDAEGKGLFYYIMEFIVNNLIYWYI